MNASTKRMTGLFDKNGTEIAEGDTISLDGNLTADDSCGILPNGYMFDEHDVYTVYFDERINNWSLALPDIDMSDAFDVKYLNHAVSLLHDKRGLIVPPKE
jgi:hypothetical protein